MTIFRHGSRYESDPRVDRHPEDKCWSVVSDDQVHYTLVEHSRRYVVAFYTHATPLQQVAGGDLDEVLHFLIGDPR